MTETTDALGLAAGRRRTLWWCAGLVLALAAAAVLGIGVGSVPIAPGEVLQVITRHAVGWPARLGWSPAVDAIVWEVRLPRVLLGACVGAGLAVCGVALQAMVRNVLAEPYVLGVNSGASCGAAAAILFGVGLGLGEHALQATAFLGALAASVLVYGVARSGGRLTSLKLLLSGVAVGYALNALTSFLVFASGNAEGSRSVMFWLLGSLSLAGWGTPLAAVVVVVLVVVAALTTLGRRLDALAIGDETADSLGISPDRLRAGLLLLVSLCVGVLVAASGSIGFVGLVVPHLARRCVGARHVRTVPVAALMGALLLVLADLVARTVLQPQELPIGILTALLGAPFLLVLVRRARSGAA
ncbi:iron ABC transporter permease [Rothia sp. AR01]|uniref:Iron ABC transporter permease n=1 Tax=Rothia santali TaxID=2949643 RepID=A0A9X2HC21_9MICC|nr:iron ABC transporter permease [Rothia santali]MCP3425360.1 iron ABC transporter permease [Rothia santali]